MSTLYLQNLRLFSRDARLFLVTRALEGGVLYGLRGVTISLYLLRLGYGPEFIGLFSAVGLLSYAGFCVPAGVLGSRWGSRRVMILAMAVQLIGMGLQPLSGLGPQMWQSGWLLATGVLGSLGAALYYVNAIPFLMSATTPRDRSYAFSLATALETLAGFVGSLIGGLMPELFARIFSLSLDGPEPYRYGLLLAVVLFIPAIPVLLAAQGGRPPARQKQSTEKGKPPYTVMILFALIVVFRYVGRGATNTFFTVYLDTRLHLTAAQIGTVVAVAQLAAVLAALITPRLVSRWGNDRTGFAAMWGSALSLLLIALIPHWAGAGLGLVTGSAALTITMTSMVVYGQELVSPRWRATMSGAVSTASGLGMASAAILGGYVITALGYRALFLAGSGATVIGTVLFGVSLVSARRRPAG